MARPKQKARDARNRATAREGERKPDRYAQITADVLESEAWRTLSGIASRVLIVLAAEFHGANNGSLTLPYSAAQQRGITSKASLQRGLKELEARCLIHKTHSGGLGEVLGCARYALGWRDVDACEKTSLRALRTSNEWARWSDPATDAKRKARGKKLLDNRKEKQNATLMARAGRPHGETSNAPVCPHGETSN